MSGPKLSERALARLGALRYLGAFSPGEAEAKDCRLIAVEHGAEDAPDRIHLDWLVDEAGYIRDVRYRTVATGLDLLAYELMAELCVGIRTDQAARITPQHAQERLRYVYDQDEAPLPWPVSVPFPILIKAAQRVKPDEEAAQPSPSDWPTLGLFERVRRIEAALDQKIRPMLASDGGGVDLVDLKSDELIVQYRGACGSCSSSVGGTLQFMRDALKEALGVELKLTVQGMEYEPFIDL